MELSWRIARFIDVYDFRRFIGCSPHIQQPAVANAILHRKSYTELLNAAALWLQPAVMNVYVFLHICCNCKVFSISHLPFHSKNEMLKSMWPDGAKRVTSITKRPVTAGTNFKNSIISLVSKLLEKVVAYQ